MTHSLNHLLGCNLDIWQYLMLFVGIIVLLLALLARDLHIRSGLILGTLISFSCFSFWLAVSIHRGQVVSVKKFEIGTVLKIVGSVDIYPNVYLVVKDSNFGEPILVATKNKIPLMRDLDQDYILVEGDSLTMLKK
jgi:hypothetical protein